ncbi:hypothetical protein EUTSA_v10009716mg [Eutrema salsugineum]|uniref:Uncharacterized protein n=1 Tax=Eutrema salsugineum TaxID=72664 RepID=V4KVG5_EUTSA|nr:hypothetical protein EUTSA_v10009716mg [Eutrema salsugineum]
MTLRAALTCGALEFPLEKSEIVFNDIVMETRINPLQMKACNNESKFELLKILF